MTQEAGPRGRSLKDWLTQFAKALPSFSNTEDVLKFLMGPARERGFERMRFHRYSAKDRSLVSMALAGNHQERVAKAMKWGQIVSFDDTSPDHLSDSFTCLRENQPVVFLVKKDQEQPVEDAEALGVFPVKRIKSHLGATIIGLPEPFSQVRVDFPLVMSHRLGGDPHGGWIGKLSCDVSDASPEKLAAMKTPIEEFKTLARVAAGPLKVLSDLELELEIDKGVEAARKAIGNCTTSEALYKYCTGPMARICFTCRHASMMTVEYDDVANAPDLVLRQTSFTKGQISRQVNMPTYLLAPSTRGLTAWAVLHRRTVRLHQLGNPESLRAQCDAYGDRISWSNTSQFHDSDSHESFLAVPIIDTEGNAAGIIRLTEKHEQSEHPTDMAFSEADQRRLERLAPEIARKLLVLQQQEFQDQLIAARQHLVSIENARSENQVLRGIMGALRATFPQKPHRKLFLINKIDPDGRGFTHAMADGDFKGKIEISKSWPMAETLTELACEKRDMCVSLNKLERAQEMRHFRQMIQECTFAMACAIVSPADPARCDWVIVVESERADISRSREGRTLRYIADVAARALHRLADPKDVGTTPAMLPPQDVLAAAAEQMGFRMPSNPRRKQCLELYAQLAKEKPNASHKELVEAIRAKTGLGRSTVYGYVRDPQCSRTKVTEDQAYAAGLREKPKRRKPMGQKF